MTQPSFFDRSLKTLFRRVPPALLRLLGVQVDPRYVRTDDVSVNLAEFRADQVFVVGEADDPDRWALHIEYQLQPDPRQLRGWFLKNAGLSAQLQMPVILCAVYLTRGGRTEFPAAYEATGGGLRNEYRFHTIHLWEHAERIRSGDLPEFAPLLVLCEDEPTEETLTRERELLLGLDVPREVRAELFMVAITVGGRYFARSLLDQVFREELEMLKETGIIEEWVAEGEARGEARGARQILLRQLRQRFGELPAPTVTRIENGSREWCDDLAVRLLDARSLEELGL